MQNHKTLLISIIAIVVFILVCVFTVQGSGNKAITRKMLRQQRLTLIRSLPDVTMY